MIRYLAFHFNHETTETKAVKLIHEFDPDKEVYKLE